MSVKNISEILFERYLGERGLTFQFEKKYPAKSKLVDYTVPINGRDFLFEVKQFENKDYPFPQTATFTDPHRPIRSKIEQAKDKFQEYEDFPCCLVMYNNNAFVMAADPHAVLGAMYGEIGIQMPVQGGRVTIATPPPPVTFVGAKGKMLHRDRQYNTRISALITLYEYHIGSLRFGRWYAEMKNRVETGELNEEDVPNPDFDVQEKHLAVSVWQNIYADIAFPNHAFRGKYDEHWGLEGDYVKRTYIGPGRVE
ncbi:MAG TPA: hypothetical protein VNX88_02690 [Terriglobales bacterium]|nr:hypothetical protein [Terriglobales bacterium]